VPHDNDPIVISLVTAGRKVHRVLVDQESSADVMFWPTFNKLQLPLDHLRSYAGCLYGFAGDQVEVRGYIELRTTFMDGTVARTEKIKYLVLNAPSAYNILLGRPTLNMLGAVPSIRHMKLKLPSMEGVVITIKSDQKEARHCYENNLKQQRSVCHVTSTPPPGVDERRLEVAGLVRGTQGDVEMEQAVLGGSRVAQVEAEKESMITPRESGIARAVITSEKRPHPAEGWVETEIRGKKFKLGGPLSENARRQIAGVIERHLDAFAWSASDMPGIDPDLLCYCLAMDP